MAVKYPLVNGNWSNAANWNDGTLPQAGDDVYADNRTITIDVATITVLSIRTDVRFGGTAGGRFNLGSGIPVFNITANILTGSVSSVVTINIGVACTLNLIGNIFGANLSGLQSSAVNLASPSIILNITGNLITGTGQRTDCVTINTASSCIVNIIGNISLGGGIQNVGFGSIRPDTPTTGITISNFNINITGTVEGSLVGVSDFSVPVFLRFGLNNTFILNGLARQILNTGYAILLQLSNNNNSITIDQCEVYAASTGNAVRLDVNTQVLNPGGVINVRKIIHPALTFKTVINPTDSRCSVIYRELLLPSNHKLQNDNLTIEGTNSLNQQIYLTQNSDISPRLPLASNVRQGISYNDGARTGTLVVPSPSNVRKSVQTDNTTGSADLTAADFWNYMTSNLNVSESIGERLKNSSTVSTTGAQIAAFNI